VYDAAFIQTQNGCQYVVHDVTHDMPGSILAGMLADRCHDVEMRSSADCACAIVRRQRAGSDESWEASSTCAALQDLYLQ
jgi:hypothetical protein